MRKLSMILLATMVLVAGCGGSSKSITGQTGGGTGTGTVTTTDPVTSMSVVASVAQIAADGSNSATISATAKDANNNLVSGATVSFAASAGGLAITQATTDANGLATATLTAGGATSGTTITVTASTGTVSGKATVTVGNAQQTISVITSLPQIPSDSSKSATITALVRNAQNQFISGVPVTITSDSGGLTVTTATTDANGAATATLSAAGDPTDRTITVTATAGASTATVPVAVTGTKLTITGPPSLVQGSQGSFTVALTDAGGNGIPNDTVTLVSSKGNTLSGTTVVTDATGQKTFTLTAVNGGTDTITASALGMQATASVSVSTQSFAFTAPAANTQVNLGATATLTVQWTAAGVAQAGQVVNFSATRGTVSASAATIDGSGNASVTISSTTAGPAVVSASGNGVTAQVNIDFIATTPTAIAVQASPSTIVTQGQSTLTATVRDANSNLVEGKAVNFTITKDSTGGSLSVASATTNAQGQATTVYTASTTTSASNGVEVSATVAGTAVTNSASLTVGGQTVFLSLGTGNKIAEFGTATTQYQLPYTVQAIDAAGNGVSNITVNFAVTSLAYIKGVRSTFDTVRTFWITTQSTSPSDPFAAPVPLTGCRTEDVNGNGVLAGNDDYNNDGKLEPGLVVSTDVASAVTAAGGSAAVNLIYPKDHAYYVWVRLTARATVSGTESSTSTDILLPGTTADFGSANTAPPGPLSPYGQATTCADYR
jgi:hypothetical protein